MKKYGLLCMLAIAMSIVACDVDVSQTGSSMASEDLASDAPQMVTVFQHPTVGDEDEPTDAQLFAGEIVGAAKTGRGGELNVKLKSDDGEEFDFNVMGPKKGDFPSGTQLNVRYRVKRDTLITGIRLASEEIEVAVADLSTEAGYQDAVRANLENAEFTIESVVFQMGEQGDLGKYLAITRGGTKTLFNAAFDSDVDNVERYAGKDVVLYGVVEKKKEVLEVVAIH